MQRRASLAALAALLLAAALPPLAHACTSLILGSGASRDGSMWLARSVDYFVDALQTNNLKCAPRFGRRRRRRRAPQHQSLITPRTNRPRRCSPAAALRDSTRHHPAHPNGLIWKAAFNNFTYLIPGPRQAYTAAPGSNIRWARIGSVEEYGWNAAGVVSSVRALAALGSLGWADAAAGGPGWQAPCITGCRRRRCGCQVHRRRARASGAQPAEQRRQLLCTPWPPPPHCLGFLLHLPPCTRQVVSATETIFSNSATLAADPLGACRCAKRWWRWRRRAAPWRRCRGWPAACSQPTTWRACAGAHHQLRHERIAPCVLNCRHTMLAIALRCA